MKKLKVRYSENVTSPELISVDFNQILESIKNGLYSKTIKRIRNSENENEKTEIKRNCLPVFTLAYFIDNYRKNDNFISTNYLLFDIDKQKTKKLQYIREHIDKFETAYCCFTSPSGNGLKIIYRLSRKIENEDEYKKIYLYQIQYLSELYKIAVDNTVDPARACYLSYDPDIIVNEESRLINVDEILKMCEKEIKESSKKQIVNESIVKDITTFLAGRIDDYKIWISIGFSLASLGENGRKHFLEISKNTKFPEDTEESINEKFDEMLKKYDSEKCSIGTLMYYANKYGYNFKNPVINKF